MTPASLRPILLVGALLAVLLAGCGSRSSLGGYGWQEGASGGASGSGGVGAVGGTFSGGGGLGAGGFSPSGGSPAGGTESGGSGGNEGLAFRLDYFKSSDPEVSGRFGNRVVLSADGRTLAVGAPGDDSSASGVNGDPWSDGVASSGAVYVFSRQDDGWVLQAFIKSPSPAAADYLGSSIALSGDGNRLAVGVVGDDSSATGIGGDELNLDADTSGAVHTYVRDQGVWSHESYIKASNTGFNDQFGRGLALSTDGNTLAVGAVSEASNATGIDGDQMNDELPFSGAVYVFSLDPSFGWSQQAYMKASNPGQEDGFGVSLALSADGSTLAVGSGSEDSATTGPHGDQYDESARNSGAVYVMTRDGTAWSQTAYLKASNAGEYDGFGFDLAISSDGATIAIGANGERSLSSGINGNQTDDSGEAVGAVYLWEKNSTAWEQVAYVKASNPQDSFFGISLCLSADGQTLLVGASGEHGSATFINGPEDGTPTFGSGAAYLFTKGDAIGWSQLAYIKASNTHNGAKFGYTVALDASGTVAAIGAPYEGGSSPGVNGDPTVLMTPAAGAAYVYTFD